VTRDALCWTLLVQHNGPMFTALTRAAVAALGLLTVVPSQARAQQSDSTLVAIVRADGVALPFARFDGRRWSPYPEPAEARARRFPQRFELPAVWAVHYANGSAKRTVRGGSSVVFNDESETWYEEWGQITDAPSRIGRDSYPLERAGLGVSGDALRAPAITFAEASARSPTWQVNRREVERAFRRAVDTVARELGPMRLRSLHIARSNVDGAQLFYVEGFAVQTPAPTEGLSSRRLLPGVVPPVRVRTERGARRHTCRIRLRQPGRGAGEGRPVRRRAAREAVLHRSRINRVRGRNATAVRAHPNEPNAVLPGHAVGIRNRLTLHRHHDDVSNRADHQLRLVERNMVAALRRDDVLPAPGAPGDRG
jgi:hypothetical protein